MQKNSWIEKQTEPINRLVNKWQQHKTKHETKNKNNSNTKPKHETKQNKAKQSKIKTESKCGIV